MEIIPDPIHVALLALPFLVAAVSLNFILWRPLLAWLDERDAHVASARHEAEELDGAAAEQLSRIEARLAQARGAVGTMRQQARQRALAAEAEIVAGARKESDRKVGEAIDRIAGERVAASATLRTSSRDLATDIASRVLGRPVQSPPPGTP